MTDEEREYLWRASEEAFRQRQLANFAMNPWFISSPALQRQATEDVQPEDQDAMARRANDRRERNDAAFLRSLGIKP